MELVAAQTSYRVDPACALSEAVLAIKLGERALARSILESLLEQEPGHEQGLLWFAALAETPQEGILILERLLSLHPHNEQARNTLSMLRLNSRASAPSESAAQAPGPSPVADPPPAASAQGGTPTFGSGSYRRAVVCPLCDWQDSGAPKVCAKCGAVWDVTDLRALSENLTTNEALLRNAVQKWEQAERHSSTFEGQINLAKAYLNLHRSHDAIDHLRRAVELRPDAHRVRRTLEQLRSRKLVLAVDDSPTIRRIVSVVLERSGFRVVLASDGEEALLRIGEDRPDLVLLDVVMPGMNGYQVCRAIRADERFRRTPVVILSSSLLDRIKGKLAGVTDYLSKPFEPEFLIVTLERHLSPAH
jgi:twitching motility two-component system response regulator PilG